MKFFERLFCSHEFETITNLYGDCINYYSSGSKIIRSVQRCKKCGKIHDSEYLDKSCNIINFNIYCKNGKVRSLE